MKIDNVSKSVTSTESGEKPQRSGKAEASAPQQDTVELSALSTQLQTFQSDAADGAVDTARVDEIKQAISEGRFKVNGDVVADRLLQTVRDLLQNRTLQ